MVKSITPRGKGRPDYSQNIEKGKVIKDIGILPYESKLKIFTVSFTDGISSIYPWIKSTPLAAGGTASLIDSETGIEMPYTVPAGYDLKILKYWTSTSQPTELIIKLDGQVLSTFNFVDYDVYFEQEAGLFKIQYIDPTLSSSHTFELQIKNMGSSPLRGTVELISLLTKVHTKEITTKDVKCPFCGNIQTVPLTQSKIVCSKCGKTYIVRALPFGGKHG